jgi:hypothetical protein
MSQTVAPKKQALKKRIALTLTCILAFALLALYGMSQSHFGRAQALLSNDKFKEARQRFLQSQRFPFRCFISKKQQRLFRSRLAARELLAGIDNHDPKMQVALLEAVLPALPKTLAEKVNARLDIAKRNKSNQIYLEIILEGPFSPDRIKKLHEFIRFIEENKDKNTYLVTYETAKARLQEIYQLQRRCVAVADRLAKRGEHGESLRYLYQARSLGAEVSRKIRLLENGPVAASTLRTKADQLMARKKWGLALSLLVNSDPRLRPQLEAKIKNVGAHCLDQASNQWAELKKVHFEQFATGEARQIFQSSLNFYNLAQKAGIDTKAQLARVAQWLINAGNSRYQVKDFKGAWGIYGLARQAGAKETPNMRRLSKKFNEPLEQ